MLNYHPAWFSGKEPLHQIQKNYDQVVRMHLIFDASLRSETLQPSDQRGGLLVFPLRIGRNIRRPKEMLRDARLRLHVQFQRLNGDIGPGI